MGHGSHTLEFTDISSSLGCMHKASFDPVNEGGHDTFAQCLGCTLVINEVFRYYQHTKGTNNIISESLSRDFHILDHSLTKILNSILPP